MAGYRMYELTYVGADAENVAGRPSFRVAVPNAAPVGQRPAPAPRPRPKPPAGQAEPSGVLVSSPRGEEPVALPAKEPTQAGEPAPGGGEERTVPAPPQGSGMVAVLPRLVFPKNAENTGAKGTVGLRVVVSSEGRPVRVEVERSSGERSLDEYARRAVERGLVAKAWVSSYVLRVEARFLGRIPELHVSDDPVEVGGA